jgi:hypothetical protein
MSPSASAQNGVKVARPSLASDELITRPLRNRLLRLLAKLTLPALVGIRSLALVLLTLVAAWPKPCLAAADTWTLIGPMTTTRVFHTATLLGNGYVLVAGGSSAYPTLTPVTSAELYNPTGKSFSSTDSMSDARVGHTATLLPNGKVLVAGGNNGTGDLNSADLYTYGLLGGFSPTDGMGAARAYHTATLLPSGQVLVAGGQHGTGVLNLSELYDPGTGQFTATTGHMQAARKNHTATLLPNGKVLVAGGEDGSGNWLPSAELYNPATGTWNFTDPMAVRMQHTATLLRNGKVLVRGGYTFQPPQLYDPATGTWSETGSTDVPDLQSMANLLWDGKALITAGLQAAFYQLYDPLADTFSQPGAMAVARHCPTAVRLADGRVLAMGGLVVSQTIDVVTSAELYEPVPPPKAGLPPLVAFYPFDGNARDLSGNARHGTVFGAPLVVSHGYEGQAYSFNGAGDYITVPVNINPGKLPKLTMGCWARTAAATPPNQAVLSHDNGGFGRALGTDFRGGGIGWSAFCGSGSVLGAVPAVQGAWTFMAVTYDQQAQTVKLQVDDMVLTKTGVSLGQGLDQLVIGASPAFNVFFKGVIDNVFIFGDVLTDQQLAYIRSGGAQAIKTAARKANPGISLLLMD